MDEVLRRLTDNTDARSRLLVERDELIIAATVDAGLPVTRVAEAAGLSRQQVHNIINDYDRTTNRTGRA